MHFAQRDVRFDAAPALSKAAWRIQGPQPYGGGYYGPPPNRRGPVYGQPRYEGPSLGYGRAPVYGGLPQRPMSKGSGTRLEPAKRFLKTWAVRKCRNYQNDEDRPDNLHSGGGPWQMLQHSASNFAEMIEAAAAAIGIRHNRPHSPRERPLRRGSVG